MVSSHAHECGRMYSVGEKRLTWGRNVLHQGKTYQRREQNKSAKGPGAVVSQ